MNLKVGSLYEYRGKETAQVKVKGLSWDFCLRKRMVDFDCRGEIMRRPFDYVEREEHLFHELDDEL